MAAAAAAKPESPQEPPPSNSAPEIISLAAPRPKRRYTRSERQRQASRRNMGRARRAARLKMKEPGYEPSPRRQAANRANLKLALEARDRSAPYAPRFRHGLSALSLERTLGMAGESLEDYRAHLARFERLFAPAPENGPIDAAGDGAVASGIRTLATALGQASWRRLRVFRTLPEWELLAVCHSLRELIRERRDGQEPTAARLADWAEHLEDYTLLHGRLYAGPKARAIDNRLEALGSRLLQERGEAGIHRRGRSSQVVRDFGLWPAEVLGNPLRSARKAAAALRDRMETSGSSGWRSFGPSASPVSGSRCDVSPKGRPLRQAQACDAQRREAEARRNLPRSFEAFLKLVQEALGGSGKQAAVDRRHRRRAGGRASVGLNSRSLGPELRELARALWDRLQVFTQQREREAQELQATLQSYTDSLDMPAPAAQEAPSQLGPLIRKVVDGLMQGERVFRRAQAPEQRVKQAVYALLVKRFGEQPVFGGLKPRTADPASLLVRALMLKALGRKAEAETLVDASDGARAAGRRKPPPRVRRRA